MAKLLLPTFLSILLLPVLADVLDINPVAKSLSRLHRTLERPGVAARRILQVSGMDEYEFVPGSKLYNHECWTDVDLQDCTYNTRVLLSNAAPEPQSIAGRWLAKLIGATYKCETHATLDACLSDEENDCIVINEADLMNDKYVDVCTLSDVTRTKIVNEYFLCPGSYMQQIYQCQLLQDIPLDPTNITNYGCISGNGVTCVLSPTQECLPKGLTQAFNLTDDAVLMDLKMAINNVSSVMWGCCPSVSIYVRQQRCNEITRESSCIGECKWFGDNTDSADLMTQDEPPCGLGRDAIRDMVIEDINTDFANYLKQTKAKCGALASSNASSLLCTNSTPIKGLNVTKADSYSKFKTVLGGGPSPPTCPTTTSPPPSPPLASAPLVGTPAPLNPTLPAEGNIGSTNSSASGGTNSTMLTGGNTTTNSSMGSTMAASGADKRWVCGVAMLALTVAAVASL